MLYTVILTSVLIIYFLRQIWLCYLCQPTQGPPTWPSLVMRLLTFFIEKQILVCEDLSLLLKEV